MAGQRRARPRGRGESIDNQSGVTTSQGKRGPGGTAPTTSNVYGAYAKRSTVGHDDEGGASQFYKLAETSEALRAYLVSMITTPGGELLVISEQSDDYGVMPTRRETHPVR
jgi:hypothetical protein